MDIFSASHEIVLEGTFSAAPRLFMQLFAVHVFFLGQMIPVVFALLPSKTQETYIRLFTY